MSVRPWKPKGEVIRCRRCTAIADSAVTDWPTGMCKPCAYLTAVETERDRLLTTSEALTAECSKLQDAIAYEKKRADDWRAYADRLRCPKCSHERGPIGHPKGLIEDGYECVWICPCDCHADAAILRAEIARLKRLNEEMIGRVAKQSDQLSMNAEKRMNLFRSGNFRLHSGSTSKWKIDCDALTDQDWTTLAIMALEILPPFGLIEGVPQGGLRFAEAIIQQCVQEGRVGDVGLPVLIVDDVLTTGRSMEEKRADRKAVGVVAFSRTREPPPWIHALFVPGG